MRRRGRCLKGSKRGACTGCCLFQTLNPKLWAAPRALTLNKLYTGSAETPGAGIISFSEPVQVTGPTHGDNPASRGMLRCWGQDHTRRWLPREHMGLRVQISRGTPSQHGLKETWPGSAGEALRAQPTLPLLSVQAPRPLRHETFLFVHLFLFFFFFFLTGTIVQRLMVLFYMNQ